MEAQLKEIQQDDIEQRALTLPEKARAIAVEDDASYQLAGGVLLQIKEFRKEINDTFDPIIAKAYAAHKEAKAQKTKVEAPLIEAEGILKPAMATYTTEQERKAREELLRLEAEARKRAEDEVLAAAAQAERDGDRDTAEAIISSPVEVAPIVQNPATPKVNGVSYRDNWTAQVTSLFALVKAIAAGQQPISLVMANLPALNLQAKSLKGEMNIPGVKSVCEKIVAVGRR